MTAIHNGPRVATGYDVDGEPMEWVLRDVSARQAVMLRAFLASVT